MHEEFFETSLKQVNLFIIGVGNVGSRLMDQLKEQQQFLLQKLHLQIRVVGIGNSKKMVLNEDGIDLNNWKEQLNQGATMELNDFMAFIDQKNLRNSVFVDVTSSEKVSGYYALMLRKSVAVVACNKIATSSPFANYELLKNLAREYNTSYFLKPMSVQVCLLSER